ALNGIDADEINGTHSIIVIDADNFQFYTRQLANATSTDSRTFTLVHDDNVIGGRIIHKQYFNRKMLVFTSIGEVATIEEVVDGYGNKSTLFTRIWGVAEAEAMSTGLVGTRRCDHWSSSTFKST